MSENRIQRPTEFRAAGEGEDKYIEGYFIVFDDIYDMGYGTEAGAEWTIKEKEYADEVLVVLENYQTRR